LIRLSSESAKVRLAMIRSAAEVAQSDAIVTRRELGIVRVVADSLDGPLAPPICGSSERDGGSTVFAPSGTRDSRPVSV